jgi:hypothetical protein
MVTQHSRAAQPVDERIEGVLVAETAWHEHERWSLADREPANGCPVRGRGLTPHGLIVESPAGKLSGSDGGSTRERHRIEIRG